MKRLLFVAGAAAVGLSAPAFSHEGPRVWVGNENGTIVTFSSDNDSNPTTYQPAQVFSAALEDLFGVFTTEFPGYEVRRSGGNVAPGTMFGFDLAGPLLVLNEAGTALVESQERYGTPGPAPQMAVSLDADFRITGNSVQAGFAFFGFAGVGDHAHLSYTLLGDGVNPVDGPNGVYALPLLLNAPGLARSDWFFILLEKNAAAGQLAMARTAAQAMADALGGDATFDGAVDISDFARLAANFNTTGRWWRHGDFNFDGAVDIGDFAVLAGNFNRTSARAAAVPEPAALGLCAAGILLARRPRGVQNDTPMPIEA